MTGDLAGARVVVLGGSGFLGRHVCAALAAAGTRQLVVSRRPAPAGAPGRWVRLDLAAAPEERLAELLRGADVLVNASGVVWQLGREAMQGMNVDLVRRIVGVLGDLRGAPRLVHLGSAYEYRAAPPGVAVTERHATGSGTGYGRTKLLGSRIVLDAARSGAINAVVLRVAVVTGPGAPPSSLLGMVARHLARTAAARDRGERPEELVLAPLRDYRDFVDVRDVADAVVAAARAGVTDAVINIGGAAALPVREVVNTMIRLAGVSTDATFAFAEKGGQPVRSARPWLLLDVGRARELLGWRPRRSPAESLRDLLTDAMEQEAIEQEAREQETREQEARDQEARDREVTDQGGGVLPAPARPANPAG